MVLQLSTRKRNQTGQLLLPSCEKKKKREKDEACIIKKKIKSKINKMEIKRGGRWRCELVFFAIRKNQKIFFNVFSSAVYTSLFLPLSSSFSPLCSLSSSPYLTIVCSAFLCLFRSLFFCAFFASAI